MNSSSEKSEYLLLFRGTDWHQNLSPDEIQRTMTDWMAWFNGLIAEGTCRGGQSLAPEARVVSGKNRTVTDGPFTEAKETVAGYFLLTVADMEEALAIAKQCPALPYGITVEVRPLLARCHAADLAERNAAAAV
ncbi:MAG TPA: YciI family protein [Chthoniobacterales bacterium]|jgi:hypothetical protein